MSGEDRVERARRALGADEAVPLKISRARGPLDLLQQVAEVSQLRDADRVCVEGEGVVMLTTRPIVLAAASLTPSEIPLVGRESA